MELGKLCYNPFSDRSITMRVFHGQHLPATHALCGQHLPASYALCGQQAACSTHFSTVNTCMQHALLRLTHASYIFCGQHLHATCICCGQHLHATCILCQNHNVVRFTFILGLTQMNKLFTITYPPFFIFFIRI